jgi:aspartyl-tRNA(Asn)/glutamyl-tRNA(Gln) amidotransferase subunit B
MTTVYEPVIGLEVHAQLRTVSKLFCGCSTAFGAAPNAHTCAICLGMPGSLPALNAQAVCLAITAAQGLECQIAQRSQWSRKNYFYPDLPKGYQITQDTQPLAKAGVLHFSLGEQPQTVRITRVHMEEDAGKNVHDDSLAGARSYVDYNRGGTPLIEIVSEPDLRSAAAAAAYLKTLRQLLRYLGVCDGNMEQGSLRCDANVSLRPQNTETLGTRVELKNINSFRFVQQAIDFEILRQTEVLQGGGSIRQETRLYDSQAKTTRPMRSKEEAHDYRYFPDPDLPDLQLAPATLQASLAALPELPQAKRRRYVQALGLSEYDARVLTDDAAVAQYFEAAAAVQPNYKAVANWIINELLRELKGRDLETIKLQGAELGELVAMIDAKEISGKVAKDIFTDLLDAGGSPRALVKKRGLTQVSDSASLQPIVAAVLAKHPDSVEKYKAGRTNVLGFLVGQVMQASGGKANPQQVNALLREQLKA